MLSKPFWLPLISFGETCLISEIAASFEGIGKITLTATLTITTTNQPQPRQSSSRIISCWMVKVWQRNAELTPRSYNGELWTSACGDKVFSVTWNTNGFKPACLGVKCHSGLQVGFACGNCPPYVSEMQRLPYCAVYSRGFSISVSWFHKVFGS